MIKINDSVTLPLGKVGVVLAVREPNATHPDGLALVRLNCSHDCKWFRVNQIAIQLSDWEKKVLEQLAPVRKMWEDGVFAPSPESCDECGTLENVSTIQCGDFGHESLCEDCREDLLERI